MRHRIVFLPDYDMSTTRFLYAGCDVWLNNPLRPMEACGASGMKSALNGGLNLSILDGWRDEMSDSENGWAIPTADGVTGAGELAQFRAHIYEVWPSVSILPVDSAGLPDTPILGHTVQVVPHHRFLTGDAELGVKAMAHQ